MYNPDTEILFPLRVLPSLRSIHGEEWQRLVDQILANDCPIKERYTFALMMVKMCGCVGCNADSFRAMRGCSQCARQTVRRNRSSDQELTDQYRLIHKEVIAYMKKMENESKDQEEQ